MDYLDFLLIFLHDIVTPLIHLIRCGLQDSTYLQQINFSKG